MVYRLAGLDRIAFIIARNQEMPEKDLTGIFELKALLGRGAEFEGKLTFEGTIRIDGRFSGEIFSDDVLVVGEGAEVRAEIEVGTLIARGGSVWGKIRASRLVEIYAPARIYADIHAPQVFLDKGAVFEGSCTMPEKAPGQTGGTEDRATSGEDGDRRRDPPGAEG
jgi:cytoskeletal protein CcmA (bactofilin family)